MEVTLEQLADQVGGISKQLTEMEARLETNITAKLDTSITSKLEAHITAKIDAATNELKEQARANADELKKQARLLGEGLRDDVKKVAEGYGATLDQINRELADLNEKFDTKFGDHDLILSNHNQRITRLESR
jgi:DNA anti-recombination protein RmuC